MEPLANDADHAAILPRRKMKSIYEEREQQKLNLRRNSLILWFRNLDKDESWTLERDELVRGFSALVDEKDIDKWMEVCANKKTQTISLHEFLKAFDTNYNENTICFK